MQLVGIRTPQPDAMYVEWIAFPSNDGVVTRKSLQKLVTMIGRNLTFATLAYLVLMASICSPPISYTRRYLGHENSLSLYEDEDEDDCTMFKIKQLCERDF
jgi:hypothetical protein